MTTRHWRARSLPEGELLGGGSGRGVEAGEELKPSAPKLMLVIRLGRRLSTEAVWRPRPEAPSSYMVRPQLARAWRQMPQTPSRREHAAAQLFHRRASAVGLRYQLQSESDRPWVISMRRNLRLLGVQSRPSSCIPRGCGRAGRPFSQERESVWSMVARPSG